MSSPLAVSLLLALLTATSALPASEEGDTPGGRRLELTAENANEQHPVRVSPRHSTHLLFDVPLQPGGVEVDGQWVKKAVNEAEGMVTLRPSGVPPSDRLLTVTVRFARGQGPERVTFRLLVHPTRGEHEVQVIHPPDACAPVHQEAQRQRERAERCEAAREQGGSGSQEPYAHGLTDLVEAGWLSKGEGIVGRKLQRGADFTQQPGEALVVGEAYSYRATWQGRVAVELRVESTDTRPWTARGVEGAEWVGPRGMRLKVVRVWQPEPLVPGAQRRLVVEAEAAAAQPQGAFLLTLGEADGPRTLTVQDVAFP